MTWFDTNKGILYELFDVLGESRHWTDDQGSLVAWMERAWLGVEHGLQQGKRTYDEAARDRAMPLLTDLGLNGRVDPQSDWYDEIIVLGAAGIGLHRRLELVRTSGIRADGLTVLAGLRPHELQARDGALDELLAASGRFGASPGWSVPPAAANVKDLLDCAGVDPLVAAAVVFQCETDLAELLLVKQWPDATVTATIHRQPHPVVNELGQRPWVLRTWSGSNAIPRLRVLNGAPVERPAANGTFRPPRPTTISTLQEWLREVAEEAQPTSVLAVVNQPHLGRVRLQLLEHLASTGRHNIRVDVAGCQTLADVDVVLLLGEIPAWIRMDIVQ